MDINDFANACHQNAVAHGFWDSPGPSVATQLMNITTEVGEAWEHYRNGHDLYDTTNQVLWVPGQRPHDAAKPDGFFVELGDVVIRVFDTMGAYGVEPAHILRIKHEYNMTRPFRHGGKRA